MDFIKSLFKSMKKLFKTTEKKRTLENCVIIIVIGIILVIGANSLFSKDSEENLTDTPQLSNQANAINELTDMYKETDIETKLKNILSSIEGAGEVDVAVTFITKGEVVPAYDIDNSNSETTENDAGGGSRIIKQNDKESTIVYNDMGSERTPFVVKELLPEVKGVIVVADGGAEPVVKESLSKAVQVLLDVPIHKVSVFERRK